MSEKKKSTTMILLLLGGIIVIGAALWFTGAYESLLSPEAPTTVGNTLALDLETLQITIKTVSSPEIEGLAFVEAIDTMSTKADLTKLRNPFTRVYVAPPPSAKPKPESPRKKAKRPVKKKKRIVRPKITINGIIWDRSAPYAILDGDIYGEGDRIKGYTVQTIQDTMIVLGNNEDIFSIVIERE